MLILCADVSSWLFLLVCCSCIQLVNRSVITVNAFNNSHQNCDDVTGWMFLINCFEWLSIAWLFTLFTLLSSRFLSTTISQSCAASRLRCCEMFYEKCTAESVIDRSLKKGQHLAKLEPKNMMVAPFLWILCKSWFLFCLSYRVSFINKLTVTDLFVHVVGRLY